MKIKKIGHSCLVIDVNGIRIMTDPGKYSKGQEHEKNISVVLISHEHEDHCDISSLKQVIANNQGVAVIAHEEVGKKLLQNDITFIKIEIGGKLVIKNVLIEAVGGVHAVVYKSLPPVTNIGFIIADKLFFPGDSLFNPEKPVDTLALPLAAPWLKVSESIDYALSIKPRVIFPIHDGHIIPEARAGMIRALPEQIFGSVNISFVGLNNGDEADF